MTEAPPRLLQAGRDCAAAFSYLTCSPCSSRQADFFLGHEVEQQQVRVCEGYCNVMYRACENAVVPGPLADTVALRFGNGTALCEALGFSPVEIHDEPPTSGYNNNNNLEARAKPTCFGVEVNHAVFSGNVPDADGATRHARGVGAGVQAAALAAGVLAATMLFSSRADSSIGANSGQNSATRCATRGSAVFLPLALVFVLVSSFTQGAKAVFTAGLASSLASAIDSGLQGVADAQLRRDELQEVYDSANYTT